jgi:hypothetical protein
MELQNTSSLILVIGQQLVKIDLWGEDLKKKYDKSIIPMM